jgi:serine/threonine protein kinase/Tfp pilus assembly protein PilF
MTEKAQWSEIEAALDAILEQAPGNRPAALARLGAKDLALCAEVESLLYFTDGDDGLLDQPAVAVLTSDAHPAESSGSLLSGERVGAYRIHGLIGRGGMGEVYRAQRADGTYDQQVALKLIRRDAMGQLARFETERQILANLSHPGIARLLDGGITAAGQPYMVMELVEGRQIIDWCTDQRADLSTRRRLFCEVCDAMAFAHRHLIVHRDLKPNNVMVTSAGTVKLLDFGAAKLLDSSSSELTHHTPFTPSYASPEQLTGAPITTATDVFALGLLLFELLTGTRPWALGKLSPAAAMNTVIDEDAPTASQAARRASFAPLSPKSLEGDLDAIVAKALRKEPERRYQTVDAFREDIVRSGQSEPVAARSGHFWYVFGRALRRHALLATSASIVALALGISAVGMTWQAEQARAEARKATAVKDFLLNIFRSNSVDNPDGAAARQTTALQLLDNGSKAIGDRLSEAPQVRGELLDTLADLYDELEEFDRVEHLESQRLADLESQDGNKPTAARAKALAEFGRALAMTDQYEKAQTVLDDAIRTMNRIGDQSSDTRVQALTTLGLVDYHVKSVADPTAGIHTAQALALLERYHSDSPDRLTATQLLARIAERRHDDDAAERGYRRFVELAESPRFKGQTVALGCALDDLGAFLASRQRFSEATPLLRRAAEVLDRAEGPDQLEAATARTHLGTILATGGQTVEAARLLHQSLASEELTQGSALPSATAPGRLDLADFEFQRGQWIEARGLYEKNLAVLEGAAEDAVHASTYSHYARLLLLQGDLVRASEAVAASEPLLDSLQDPRAEARALNLVTLADIAESRHQFDDAEHRYAVVKTEWAPSVKIMPPPYLNAALGQIELDLDRGRPETAVDHARDLLQRVLALADPEYRSDTEARAHLALGRALLTAGQPAAAEQELSKAVALRAPLDVADSPELAFARLLQGAAARENQAPGGASAWGPTSSHTLAHYPVLEKRYRSVLNYSRLHRLALAAATHAP